MKQKIVIALQFWEGDRDQAMRLINFLADLEPKHNELADFLLVYRPDCRPPGAEAQYLSRKFNTFVYRSPKSETGWPQGCNALAEATCEWVSCMIEANRVPKYKCVFLCEADGGPVSRDWVAKMSQAWDTANARQSVVIAGPLVYAPAEHINGNCMVTCDPKFMKWFTRGPRQHTAGGWDYVMWPVFKQKGAANIIGMRSYYNTPHFSLEEYEQMRREDLIWVHGDKSGDLIKWGRQQLLNYPTL